MRKEPRQRAIKNQRLTCTMTSIDVLLRDMVHTFPAASMGERSTREHGERLPILCRFFVVCHELEASKKSRYNEE
jgi:hypothetical protein